MQVSAWSTGTSISSEVTVSASETGTWLANFSGSLDLTDIRTMATVLQYDDDGDRTNIYWDELAPDPVPKPPVYVNPETDVVSGEFWTADSTVTLTINDVTVDDPLSVDQDGNFRFELSGVYDVQPGQTVVVSSNDGITKSHQVLTMGIDNVSIDDDTVTGTAASGSTIFVYASNTLDNEQVRTVVAQDGYWTVDYLDTMDIIPGSGIEISQLDTDGDWTYFRHECE